MLLFWGSQWEFFAFILVVYFDHFLSYDHYVMREAQNECALTKVGNANLSPLSFSNASHGNSLLTSASQFNVIQGRGRKEVFRRCTKNEFYVEVSEHLCCP